MYVSMYRCMYTYTCLSMFSLDGYRVSPGIPNFLTELPQQYPKVKSKTTISAFSSAPYTSDWNDY